MDEGGNGPYQEIQYEFNGLSKRTRPLLGREMSGGGQGLDESMKGYLDGLAFSVEPFGGQSIERGGLEFDPPCKSLRQEMPDVLRHFNAFKVLGAVSDISWKVLEDLVVYAVVKGAPHFLEPLR